ncbi:MAG: efflux RND transporter periplasmic adaptor subunit [Victivallaceae bacterium]
MQYARIGELATGNLRNFPGIIHARDSSLVSFEDIGGKVRTVNVQIGEKVTRGQVIATLDSEKFTLDLHDAQAELKKTDAQIVKAESDYRREKELFDRGASFAKKLDTIKYELEAATSNQRSAKARLGQAERNLKNTDLIAPYDGFVSERLVEPNQIVTVGQGVFKLDAEGMLEVHFDIPENLRKRIAVGMPAKVTFPGMPKLEAEAKITYFGTAAGTANSFPVKALLNGQASEIKPGMSAEVQLTLPLENPAEAGFLVPVKAILPGEGRGEGFVFVFDPRTSTVRKVRIDGMGMQNNFGIVRGDLRSGDLIATAGVGFLLDGQKVKLYQPVPDEAGNGGNR